jgi:tripartite-type tricarboxylate transporter receptor subunit TctC
MNRGLFSFWMTGLAVLGALTGASPAAIAQTEDAKSFPSRAIRIVVPASPGGVNDILARLVGQKMSESFGQPVVIENKPGAATILGAETVARSAPDGYTLLIAPTATLAINPAVYSKLSYAPQKDFIPISAVATYPYVLTANAEAPAKTVQDLIAFAKANPDKANAGGASMTFQLLTEMFKAKTGAPIQYIPYKGANDANLALIGGQLTVSFLDVGPASPNIKAGKIKALAVTAPKRLGSLPDVPTMAEAGLKDMTVESWAGLFVPTGTPSPIVQKLQDEVMRIVKQPDFQSKLKALELTPVGNSSKDFADMLAKDIAMWAEIARAANVKVN